MKHKNRIETKSKTDFDTRTGLDQSNISDIIAPAIFFDENQILKIKENGLSKLESIRTEARWPLSLLFQPKIQKQNVEKS